ncbi:MAG: type VI secretion system baseplate subunit TssF [Pseudomonadota bacterium]
MDRLLPKFQSELLTIKRLAREFSEQYPRLAGKLHMSGEVCEDPFVEHLIQSAALVAARISLRLDDDYPQFTEALLEALYPHYLRPFPSTSIVHMDCSAPMNKEATSAATVARGTIFESAPVQGVRCKFKTVYEMTLAPIALSAAAFDPLIRAPANVHLPRGASCTLRITIEAKNATVPLSALGQKKLRVFIDGESSFCAALRDTLFMHCARAYVEITDGNWNALPELPITPVGFADEDALIPYGPRSHRAYRLLTEYFAFPEKFNFFDLELEAILAKLPADCRRFTLHLALTGVRPDSGTARMLRTVSADNFLLACTPVVNLFQQPGVPVSVSGLAADYTILADSRHARAYEIHSIDAVHMLHQRPHGNARTEFRPFYSLRHGEGEDRQGHYWLMRHDDAIASVSPGHEKRISLVDTNANPIAIETSTLSVGLTCTNRDLPASLDIGRQDGDFIALPLTCGNPVRFLRRPTPSYRYESGHGFHWRLISHLNLNQHAISDNNLEAFREMLTLNDIQQSPVSQRQIAAITGMERLKTSDWQRGPRGTSLVHGIELRLTLDEDGFVGSGMHLFVQIIDQFFALYVQLSSFVEVVAISKKTGEEIIRCKPRIGSLSPA